MYFWYSFCEGLRFHKIYLTLVIYFMGIKAFAGGPLVQARNFAVMTGVNAGISCVMKRIRGVEDVQTR